MHLTNLETLTQMNVFCEDLDFMTVASSVVSRFGLVSSDVFEMWPEDEEESDNSPSWDRVRCREGTCSESAAAFLRSVKERDVADFLSVGTASLLGSDLDPAMSSDARRGLRGVAGVSGAAGESGDGGS